jgi:cytochrome o ubiquinol oxidase subunit 1
VKIFNWLFTMYRGRVQFTTPVLWTIGFVITFTLGGMTGVMLAIPGADFVLHNSLFLIAHFHNAIIGGLVFGYFAGVQYWWPKVFGFKLDEKLGRNAFICWFVGFFVAFVPIYILGFMGATRRLNHYDNPAWQPFFIVAAIGVGIIALGVVFQVLQIVVSIIRRNQPAYRDITGDPWNGRTLEWTISSPPPVYNFANIPAVRALDDFADAKEHGRVDTRPYRDIHMPSNTSAGLAIGLFALAFGFAAIWHIWWLAVVGLVGVVATAIGYSFRENAGFIIPAATVKSTEERNRPPKSPVKAGAERELELEAM